MGEHSSADPSRPADPTRRVTNDRGRVVEEAVRMASSLAERATRDVRELTRELADAGRAEGAGSVSFLMGRLMELAGGVTSFVQELQHYELVRREPLPVVSLMAPTDPVIVVVREGSGTTPAASFLLENDLARGLDTLDLVAEGSSGADRATVSGPDGEPCGTVELELADGPWIWGERRRVTVHAELTRPLVSEAIVTFRARAEVGEGSKLAPNPIELAVRQERPGHGP